MSKLSIEDYRDTVLNCKTCRGCVGIVNTPRFGTGCRVEADLMIVGQNPPVDPVRGLHGAFLLHYKDESIRGPHEKLVHDLVSSLGLTTKQVWATQATKCPTVANTPVPLYVAKCCAGSFLEQEIRDVNPKVIICFGQQVERVVGDLFRYSIGERPERYDQSYPVITNGDTPLKLVRRSGSIIAVPHPSTVGRFVNRQSWIDSIRDSYLDAMRFRRAETTIEGGGL